MNPENFAHFIENERDCYSGQGNNRFAFAINQVWHYFLYTELILGRYLQSSESYIEQQEIRQRTFERGPSQLSQEEEEDWIKAVELGYEVQFEIESYYMFSKVLLDKIAKFLWFYFGQERGLSIGSNDKLCKNGTDYFHEKGVAVNPTFLECAKSLHDEISVYRDKQIAHLDNFRVSRGLSWTKGKKNPIISSGYLHPEHHDKYAVTTDLAVLHHQICEYAALLCEMLIANREKSKLMHTTGDSNDQETAL